MPPRSKAQARFMGLVASGKIQRKGVSKSMAREYLRGSKQKNLPEHSKKGKR